jgi:hypothetical protein
MMKPWDSRLPALAALIAIGWIPSLLCAKIAAVTKQNEFKAVLYATIVFSGFLVLSLVVYVVRRTCPNGLTFSPVVRLEDIHLDGLEDIEASLRSSIDKLKVRWDKLCCVYLLIFVSI